MQENNFFQQNDMQKTLKILQDELAQRNESPFWADKVCHLVKRF